VYIDQNKVKGVDVEDKEIKNKIYNQYIKAFEKGVYNYIKEDYDATTQKVIPRKYFSGGLGLKEMYAVTRTTNTRRASSPFSQRRNKPKVRAMVNGELSISSSPVSDDDAMLGSSPIAWEQLELEYNERIKRAKSYPEIKRLAVEINFKFHPDRHAKNPDDFANAGEVFKRLWPLAVEKRDKLKDVTEEAVKEVPVYNALVNDLKSPFSDERIAAIRNLEEYEDKELIPHISELLGDSNKDVRQAAEEALWKRGITLEQWILGYIKALSSIFSDARKDAVLKIAQIARDGYLEREDVSVPKSFITQVKQTVRRLNLKKKASRTFQEIVEYGNIHIAKEPLLELLSDGMLSVIEAAEAAIKVLSVNDEERVEAYRKALDSIHSDTRENALNRSRELANQTDISIVKERVLELLSDGMPSVIEAAEAAIEVLSVSDEERVGAYRKALDSIHSDTRENAKGALKQLGISIEGDDSGMGRKPFASSPIDSVIPDNKNIPGGIDFNANNLNLKEQGQAADINFTNFPAIEPNRVNGITPVIINITPIINFPLLLGESEEQLDEFSLSQLN
ncbi:MAG: HEAT repeat domain-containing protein, partial [Candidatus Heimdallarchaeota archaeon]|nr:HEAT repeat domain-containing protein [Candidatus Heimdallarchaeota archaeon]